MNALGLFLIGAAVRGLLVAGLGALLYILTRPERAPTRARLLLNTLAALMAITALAASPWPHWWNLAPLESSRLASVERDTAAVAPTETTTASSPISPGINPRPELESPFVAAWNGLFRALRSPAEMPPIDPAQLAPAPTRSPWRWSAWLALALVTVWTLGLVRLFLGLLAIRRLRGRCSPITDHQLDHDLHQVQAELRFSRPLDVRESSEIASPATVGFRRPALLLPADWRDWAPEERRAVLAHELAHIERGDYLAVVLAQVCLLLHIYNPLAHWLVGRLRLEQELAADARAARLAGGQRPYLATLARMALA